MYKSVNWVMTRVVFYRSNEFLPQGIKWPIDSLSPYQTMTFKSSPTWIFKISLNICALSYMHDINKYMLLLTRRKKYKSF